MIEIRSEIAVATEIFCSISRIADLALFRQRDQQLLDLIDDDRGKPLGRLVEDKEFGIAEQRPGNREHLLLAAGELAAAMLRRSASRGKVS